MSPPLALDAMATGLAALRAGQLDAHGFSRQARLQMWVDKARSQLAA